MQLQGAISIFILYFSQLQNSFVCPELVNYIWYICKGCEHLLPGLTILINAQKYFTKFDQLPDSFNMLVQEIKQKNFNSFDFSIIKNSNIKSKQRLQWSTSRNFSNFPKQIEINFVELYLKQILFNKLQILVVKILMSKNMSTILCIVQILGGVWVSVFVCLIFLQQLKTHYIQIFCLQLEY
eukprot:TRINITY_DN9853_c0_g1_i7.p2 TRINITY_DN9853_c0_g1~~TRINITY_DN9853_c0_g1_i7.p2  ORF type:complete len:182 (+),score=3.20 TRINITY_DN9853_c0_g1_i7:166-711(+)